MLIIENLTLDLGNQGKFCLDYLKLSKEQVILLAGSEEIISRILKCLDLRIAKETGNIIIGDELHYIGFSNANFQDVTVMENIELMKEFTEGDLEESQLEFLLESIGMYSEKDLDINLLTEGRKQILFLNFSLLKKKGIFFLDNIDKSMENEEIALLKECIETAKGKGNVFIIGTRDGSEYEDIADMIFHVGESPDGNKCFVESNSEKAV